MKNIIIFLFSIMLTFFSGQTIWLMEVDDHIVDISVVGKYLVIKSYEGKRTLIRKECAQYLTDLKMFKSSVEKYALEYGYNRNAFLARRIIKLYQLGLHYSKEEISNLSGQINFTTMVDGGFHSINEPLKLYNALHKFIRDNFNGDLSLLFADLYEASSRLRE